MNDIINELRTKAGTDISGKWQSVEQSNQFAMMLIQICIDLLNDKSQSDKIKNHFQLTI